MGRAVSEENVVDEAVRITDAAEAAGVPLRVLGGVAIALHASHGVHPAVARSYDDVDLVAHMQARKPVTRLLKEIGYEPNQRFNSLHGERRLVFIDSGRARRIDVFVGDFDMCHRIPLGDRLEVDTRTIPLAELLLTKLQVVRLNPKDLGDIYAIVVEHDVGDDDRDKINGPVVARLLSSDWGLWRTSRQSKDACLERVGDFAFSHSDQELIRERLQILWETVESHAKTLRWRMRAKVGDRAIWYELPDEVEHARLNQDEQPESL